MKMEEPLKCETKSRATRRNTTEIISTGTQCRLLFGILQVFVLLLLHTGAVEYSCRSEEIIASIFGVSKIFLDGCLTVHILNVASH
jgi:Ca2+/Na+ antiporter